MEMTERMKESPVSNAVKTGDGHIEFLDQLRGMAIFWVFTYHCVVVAFWPLLGSGELKWDGWMRDWSVPASFLAVFPLTLGWIGVPMFFVVSGFCIHLSHVKSRKPGWKVFFIRRFFRIYPPYLAALLFFGLLFPWTRLHFSADILHTHAEWFYSTMQMGVHVFLLHNFSEISVTGINPAFWSIAVEVQLYLLYPLVFWMLRFISPRRVLWIVGFIEVGLRMLESLYLIFHPGAEVPIWFAKEPLIYWFSWLMGAVLAEAFMAGRALPFQRLVWIAPALLLGCYFIKPLFPLCFTLAALSTASLMALLLMKGGKINLLGFEGLSRHFHFSGTVSYSAYLIHMPLLYMVPTLLERLSPGYQVGGMVVLISCLLAWLPILGLSWLVYRAIELPSIAWGKNIIARLT